MATTRSDPAHRAGAPSRPRRRSARSARAELAFTVDEARELLVGQERIALEDDEIEMLVDRTEGWPAGLYLAAFGCAPGRSGDGRP